MLRADARVNRDRALDAARELLAEHGLDVTMREVARRAEVGPATLYRRFPTKQHLVLAAFHDELRACEQVVARAVAEPDPWRALRELLEQLLALNARNQGFTDAFLATHPDVVDFSGHRTRLLAGIAGVLRRAQDAGAARRDATLDDVVLVLHAGRGLGAVAPAQRARAASRLAALTAEGLRAAPGAADLPPAPRLVGAAIAAAS